MFLKPGAEVCQGGDHSPPLSKNWTENPVTKVATKNITCTIVNPKQVPHIDIRGGFKTKKCNIL